MIARDNEKSRGCACAEVHRVGAPLGSGIEVNDGKTSTQDSTLHRAARSGTGVTYEEIARAAGVSTATVSRVLSGSAPVSDRRRRLVLETAERMAYRPSRPARALRRQQADMVGLVVADVE